MLRQWGFTTCVFFIFVFAAAQAHAQESKTQRQQGQRVDSGFRPNISNPRYAKGNAPTVAIDEGHGNFHTIDGRFRPFATVLEADGCKVIAHESEFSDASLAKIDLLVIANALSRGENKLSSAFTKPEIETLLKWIKNGGSLLLLADHSPYGEAAETLGEALGVEMSGGFVLGKEGSRIRFSLRDETLRKHAVTLGSGPPERVSSVTSFTGQALKFSSEFTPLLRLDRGSVLYPDRRSAVQKRNPANVAGWHQGGLAAVGKGRVAVFGEAGMFSAQISVSGKPMGMNAPGAEQNQQFLINVVHWLVPLR
ncbi:MAG TPA: hypothetical protein DDW52_09745 [Planctomycetaceae bacterium]|nr:hypothetical protein [Planctomycetaceae bacterium]